MSLSEVGTTVVKSAGPLPKAATGIRGFDEITYGGLPKGRPSLVCGGAGSGKTLFGMEFLVRGVLEFGEPGVFMAFEETAGELALNVASLGFDLNDLISRKLLAVDHVRIERNEIEETGEYDLEGLFIRLGYAIDSIGARRVVLDTLESLFASFSNEAILRAELRRLLRFLKDRGVTAVITGERGEKALSRHGLEEYVSDCVILLDHRVNEQISTRRLRVVKYRGSKHGTNEYPFIIEESGISVLPITSVGLEHPASSQRHSSGVPQLDAMLGGKGFFRGSCVLISGAAGTGKTSIAARCAEAAAQRGERVLYFAFEESPSQIIRNMRSIGIELELPVQTGLIRLQAVRSTTYGLETHLADMHRRVEDFRPDIVVVDPITSFTAAGTEVESKVMLTRLIDFFKNSGITAILTSLTAGGTTLETSTAEISSLVDTWLLLRIMEGSGERNRGVSVLKSRGMAHSNQMREFMLTDHGIELVDVYTGPAGVLTGSARRVQEARDRAEALLRDQEIKRKQRELERRRQLLEHRIVELRGGFEADEEELLQSIAQGRLQEETLRLDRREIARLRGADLAPTEQGMDDGT